MNTSYDGLGASAEVVTCPGQRRAEVKVLTIRGLGAICLVLLKAGSSRFPRKRGVEKQLRKYVLLWTRSAKRGHLTLLFRLPYGCQRYYLTTRSIQTLSHHTLCLMFLLLPSISSSSHFYPSLSQFSFFLPFILNPISNTIPDTPISTSPVPIHLPPRPTHRRKREAKCSIPSSNASSPLFLSPLQPSPLQKVLKTLKTIKP